MSGRGRAWRQSADPLEAARGRVERHLGTTLSTAPTEPMRDPADAIDEAVLVEPEPVDPDADLMPGFRRGLRSRSPDPELRAAVRDLAEAVLLLFSVLGVVVRRQAPTGCAILAITACAALAGAGIAGAAVAAFFLWGSR